jgi:methionyl-tRNA formyltransferase
MKIVLYTRRNVGMYCLSHLVALGHDVSVITDDLRVMWLAERYGCSVVSLDTMGEFDLFLCIHGNKIIPERYLRDGYMVNIHPCLYKYKGHNPIKRYILGKDTEATVESQWMIEEVDAGDVIHREDFITPICNNYADFYNVAMTYYYKCLDETLNRFIG